MRRTPQHPPGRVTILRDLNWRIRAGEHWVILGANGSGKTSLLSALTGYFSATEGEISLLGERFGEADWRELRTQIGVVSSSVRLMMAETETALESVVTGKYAMIDYWGKVKPADAREARRLLRSVECAYLANRPWAVLSQGERQRVLIARALMGRPRLLILDEPCAGLDPVAREHFMQFVNRLGKHPARRRWYWSPITWRRSCRCSPMCCSCATARRWPRAASARC